MATSVDPAVFEALKEYTSSDICDSPIKLDVLYGGYLQGITMFSPERQTGTTKIFGPAYTVKLVNAKIDTKSPTPSEHFVDAIPKDSVVFISQPKNMYVGVWGGLMSTRAKKLGALGTIVDGSFRDIMEHKALEYPVFAKDFSIVGSRGFTRPTALNVPVEFTSPNQPDPLIINPGDLLMADSDGIVSIPIALAEKCLALCQERSEVDRQTRECLDAGEPFGTTVARLRK